MPNTLSREDFVLITARATVASMFYGKLLLEPNFECSQERYDQAVADTVALLNTGSLT